MSVVEGGRAGQTRESGAPTLEVSGLSAGYGTLRVLHDLSFTIDHKEVVGILGANSAGKTTLLRAVAGVIRPTAGTVRFLGQEVAGTPDHKLTEAGMGHVPSGRELFPALSVEDNLQLGAYRVPKDRAAELRTRVLDLFPPLATMLGRRAGALSGGQQQMLAFGRALMTDPRLLLLDEPSTGLAPAVIESLFEALRRLIVDGDMSVILVEQNAELALQVIHRAYVLRQGRFVLEGTSDDLRGTKLVDAYLGT